MNFHGYDAPDWSYWRLFPVTLDEAVALSLNVDPRPQWGSGGGLFTYHLPSDRRNLARRCVGWSLPAAMPPHGQEAPCHGQNLVKLGEFARWALDRGWDIPVELRELVDNNMLSTSSDDNDEPDPPKVRAPLARRLAARLVCEQWLIGLMRDGPTKTRGEYAAEARQKFVISHRSFLHVWANAIAATGAVEWSKPGPKSQRRIDTPNKS
jgi:hypothetical protein